MLNLSTPAHALGMVVKFEELAPVLVTTAIFTAFGLIVFGIAYVIILKATPFSVRKEIEEDQNVALGVIIAGVAIALALVISAAVSG